MEIREVQLKESWMDWHDICGLSIKSYLKDSNSNLGGTKAVEAVVTCEIP